MIAHVHSLFLISLLNCFVESLLFRVIRYTALADNIDLDLSRVFQFSFDLLVYVSSVSLLAPGLSAEIASAA